MALAGFAVAQGHDRLTHIDWLSKNAIWVRSIDPNLARDDFADLKPLGARIGAARIVVLGEPSHGDGAAFLAKSRIVKFLHQKLGFDVLAWEAGLFNCYDMNATIHNADVPVSDVMKRGLYPIWSSSAQVRPVFEYARSVAATKRPLEMVGFDVQFSGLGALRWRDAMVAFTDKVDPTLLPAALRASLMDETGAVLRNPKATPESIRSLAARWMALPRTLDNAEPRLRAAHGTPAVEVMRRSADDALLALESLARFRSGTGNFNREDSNYRDQGMAANLIWLANQRYPGRRIIVWTASFHALHSPSSIKLSHGSFTYDGVVTMGELARKAFGKQMYTIAFTAAEGEAGAATGGSNIQVQTAQDESFEALCLRVGHPFLYVDFAKLSQSHWLGHAMAARPLSYSPIDTAWARQFDGLFFIRRMFPATPVQMAPEQSALTSEPRTR